jgi:hypothetical protein
MHDSELLEIYIRRLKSENLNSFAESFFPGLKRSSLGGNKNEHNLYLQAERLKNTLKTLLRKGDFSGSDIKKLEQKSGGKISWKAIKAQAIQYLEENKLHEQYDRKSLIMEIQALRRENLSLKAKNDLLKIQYKELLDRVSRS